MTRQVKKQVLLSVLSLPTHNFSGSGAPREGPIRDWIRAMAKEVIGLCPLWFAGHIPDSCELELDGWGWEQHKQAARMGSGQEERGREMSEEMGERERDECRGGGKRNAAG